jgi:hypothetical protein
MKSRVVEMDRIMKLPRTQALNIGLGAIILAMAGMAQAASVVANASEVFSLKGSNYLFTGTSTFSYSDSKLANDATGGVVTSALAGTLFDALDGVSTSPETKLTLDSGTGAILLAATTGGERQVAKKNGLMTGGTLDVKNLTWNATTKTLYADVQGTGLVLGDIGARSQLDFFTVKTVTGSSIINGAGTFSSTLSGIYLTTNGIDYITKSLGLGSLAALVTKGTDFGTITSTFTVKAAPAAAVPEASSAAMLALGITGLTLAARRRMRKARQHV